MPRRFDSTELSPQAGLRREHERVILRAITTGAVVSRTQLAADHDLSAQAVGRIVRDLLDAGLIEEVGIVPPAGPGAPRVGPDRGLNRGGGLPPARRSGRAADRAADAAGRRLRAGFRPGTGPAHRRAAG